MATLYRKEGQTQVVDSLGNLQNYSGNLDTLQVYKPSNSIPQNQLQTGSQPQIGQQQFDTSGADALTSGALLGADQFQNDYNRYLDASQNKEGDNNLQFLLNDYLKASSENTGYGASQLQAEQQLGIPDLQKQRATSQGLIKTGIAEYNALKAGYEAQKAQIEAGAGRKGLTTGAVMGQQGAVDRAALATLNNKAADIGILQAQDQALAGNIEAAQKTADRAVDLMYKDREAVLATKKLQYELNKDLLDKMDAKANKALDYALNKEATNLADTKAIASEAAKNGASIDVIKAITGAKDYKEALVAAGNFLQTPQTDIIKLDNGQTMLIDKRTGKVIKNFGGSKASTSSGNQFAVSQNMLKTNYNNDAVSLVANVIKSSGAKQNQSMTDAINVIAGIQQLVKDAPSGEFKGLAPIRLLPNKAKSPEALTNLSNIEAVNLKVQQWASGAALTAQQTKQVEKLTPQKGDTDIQVKAKSNALANYMMSQVSGQLAGQGIGFTSEKIDYFAPSSQDQLTKLYSDPNKKAQIEQAIQLYPNATADEILQIVQ